MTHSFTHFHHRGAGCCRGRCKQPAKISVSPHRSSRLLHFVCATHTKEWVWQMAVAEVNCPAIPTVAEASFLCLSLCCILCPCLLDGAAGASTLHHNQDECNPQTKNITPEPLNLSSRDKPRSPLHKANGRIPGIVTIICWLLCFYYYYIIII